jgi:hypothetical protein
MTKKEEIEAAYRERELQDEQRLEELRKEFERQELLEEEERERQDLLNKEESEKREEELIAQRQAEIEAAVDSFFNQEEESEPVSQKRHSSIDYESLTMNAIMGGYGDTLGFD